MTTKAMTLKTRSESGRTISSRSAVESFHRFGGFNDLVFVDKGDAALHGTCGKRMTFPKVTADVPDPVTGATSMVVNVFRQPRSKKEKAHIRLWCEACEVEIELSPTSWMNWMRGRRQ